MPISNELDNLILVKFNDIMVKYALSTYIIAGISEYERSILKKFTD